MIKYNVYIIIEENERMNTKISEEKIKKVDKQISHKTDKVVMPGRAYFVILTVTVILLLSFLVAFFAVFANQSSTNNVEDDIPPQTDIVQPLPNYISKRSANAFTVDTEIRSNNVILVELGSNESIAEKDADERIYPASMTKVMSLLIVCERAKNLNTKLKVTKEVADYAARMDGSGYLSGKKNLNDELTIKDLLYLTSYYSDTIAIIMLANYVAGSEAAFVRLMNNKAKALGLENTNFANCTGLHDENNYSTCREIAAIMAYALDNPLCEKLLTSTEVYKIKTNSNDYTLWMPSWYGEDRFEQKTRLETVTGKGGKTGYIEESGICLVSYAESNSTSKRYIQVIVGRPKGSGLTAPASTEEVKFVYNTYAN